MIRILLLSLSACGVLLLQTCRLSGQDVPERLKTGYGPLDERLSSMVTGDSLALSAAEAHRLRGAVFLDAREPEEYAVSHLPGARQLGYDRANYGVLTEADRDRPLVVYCTVGYRSERAAERLRGRGFRRVYNLYGSLYAWKLAGLPLVDSVGRATDRIHTYNRKWGTYFPDSLGQKVY